MSREITTLASTGRTLYAVLVNAAGLYMNGIAAEAYNAAHWTNYAIAMTPDSGGGNVLYTANAPTGLPGGTYTVMVQSRAGSTPATSDVNYAEGTLIWNGASEGGTALAVTIVPGSLSSELSVTVNEPPVEIVNPSPGSVSASDSLIGTVS